MKRRIVIIYLILDKCFGDQWNYKTTLSHTNPKIKIFIELLAKRLKYEITLENKIKEKTMNLISDLKKKKDNNTNKFNTLSGRKISNNSSGFINKDELDF
jgi:hypothetical protein